MIQLGNCLAGRVALVTGAGRGIGRAVAELAARCGVSVGVVDLDQAAAAQTAAAITAAGGTAVWAVADIRDDAAVTSAAQLLADRFGRLDVVLACAGVYPAMALTEITDAHWQTVVDVNLKGTLNTLKVAARLMIPRKSGRIVIVSSITGNRVGYPGLVAYSAAKAGINGLIRSAAMELAPHQITVNGVEPGTVMTEGFRASAADGFAEKLAREIPLKRIGQPLEIAGPVLFLASDAAGYITGQTIIVDGGQTLPEMPYAIG